MALRDTLERGSRRLALALDDAQIEQLLAYLALLRRWRRVYNLVGTDDPGALARDHLLDSLAAAPYLRGARLLDLGSGAGLPGLPLAVARPATSVVLLDASAKRTRFLVHAVAELGLDNVEVVRGRAETYNPPYRFDTVIARALAGLRELALLGGPLCAAQGQLLALKGRLPGSERQLAGTGFAIAAEYGVTQAPARPPRCIVRLERERKTLSEP